MNNRYLGAVIISPLIIFLFLGGAYLHFLIMILSLMGMYEFYRVTRSKHINPAYLIGYVLCILYYGILYLSGNISVGLSTLILFVLLLMCLPVMNSKYNFIDISITVLGFIYVAVFFSFISLVDKKEYGSYLVWLIFISSWATDTVAYYTGRAFGSHKLSERVSPKKTIEGSIGGFIGSIIVCGIFGIMIGKYINNISIYHFLIIGALCGMLCQFGDLAASSIKRFTGVKDYSNLIPGHGGILDRFDSILFASVIVYYYITFIMGI